MFRFLWLEVDTDAMNSNQYSRILNLALNTKRERETYN